MEVVEQRMARGRHLPPPSAARHLPPARFQTSPPRSLPDASAMTNVSHVPRRSEYDEARRTWEEGDIKCSLEQGKASCAIP